MPRIIIILGLLGLAGIWNAAADGPADNEPTSVRRVPPLGIEVPEADAAALSTRIAALRKRLAAVKESDGLVPDVEVLIKAVDDPLRHQEMQKEGEIKVAYGLLDAAEERLGQLEAGRAPWTRQAGLVLRGFRSRLDGSVQPYGLEIPETYDFDGGRRHRLDLWFHGRGERTTELGFAQQRMTKPGRIRPEDAIVLHPYARYSNGNKLAGEIDCLEALAHVQENYRIDEDRVVVRGFSMGGAACWNFAVHYADRWMAANPGAGFSETPDFLTIFQWEKLRPTWYQRKLWHLYDCTDYALNLAHLPAVAYSGEVDRQIQAAELMEWALAEEGIELTHVIGPDMGHGIDEASRDAMEARLASIERHGRNRTPETVRFTTWTLRYPKMHWVRFDALDAHWERARIEARVTGGGIEIRELNNVKAFTLRFEPGECPLHVLGPVPVVLDGREIETVPIASDRSWEVHLRRGDGGSGWNVTEEAHPDRLAKRPGLQGPIDDAFLDSFVFVRPTGKPHYDLYGEFVHREMNHAIKQWRQQFRGDVRIVKDSELTKEDIANHHLILWGDFSSNRYLAQVLDRLPLSWDGDQVALGSQRFNAHHHVPLLIHPNPENPDRYLVLNSGFTYREYDYLNNARQVPKLPDWAVVDARTPMTSQGPGEIVAADFFGENWEVRDTDFEAEQAAVDAEMAGFQAAALRKRIGIWNRSEKTKALAAPLEEVLRQWGGK